MHMTNAIVVSRRKKGEINDQQNIVSSKYTSCPLICDISIKGIKNPIHILCKAAREFTQLPVTVITILVVKFLIMQLLAVLI